MREKIVSRAARTILEDDNRIMVGGHIYNAAPPCAATLIRISELIELLPEAPKVRNSSVMYEALATAKDLRVVYKILAVLLIGARGRGFARVIHKFRLHLLEERLLNDCTNKEAYDIALLQLKGMQVEDFFALSVSLQEIGLIQKVRETEKMKTTASGQS